MPDCSQLALSVGFYGDAIRSLKSIAGECRLESKLKNVPRKANWALPTAEARLKVVAFAFVVVVLERLHGDGRQEASCAKETTGS